MTTTTRRGAPKGSRNRAGTGTKGDKLNIRISPEDKAALVEGAARRGLNQSDYVVTLVRADNR